MKIKGTLYFLLTIVIVLLNTCDEKERINPWDLKNTLDPGDWAPQNVEYIINSETSVTISWDYNALLPQGFKIDRKAGDSNWHNEYAVLNNDERSFTDTSINLYDDRFQYRVYAYASDNESAKKDLAISKLIPPDGTTGTVTDYDGNVYQTVIINGREWMAENLRITKYNNGNAIPTGLSNTEWSNTTSGAYAIYNNDDNMFDACGLLYNWYAVNDTRGLCPEGWSVPSDADWTVLVNYVVAQGYPNNSGNPNGAGNALKSCRQVDSPLGGDCDTSEHPRWNSHSTHSGFDAFGFSALPGGRRWSGGGFSDVGLHGLWWSATESSGTGAWGRRMGSGYGRVARDGSSKPSGFSIRCIRDLD